MMRLALPAALSRQRGAALITALLVLGLMTLLTVTAVGTDTMELRMAVNLREGEKARNAALDGMTERLEALADPCGGNRAFSAEFARGAEVKEAASGAGAYVAEVVNNPGDPAFGSGTDSDNLAIIRVGGLSGAVPESPEAAWDNAAGAARMELEAVVQASASSGDYAVLSGGNLLMNGALRVDGCQVDIHANGDITILGPGDYTGLVTAQGLIDADAGASFGAGSQAAAGTREVPTVNPAQLGAEADFILGADGTVSDPAGQTLYAAGDSGGWEGWTYSGGTWTLSADFPPAGIYHVEGDALISGNPGSPPPDGAPWQGTIVADGNLEVSGLVNLVPAPAAPALEGAGAVGLAAGGDLRVAAVDGSRLGGVLAAREQIEVAGLPGVDIGGALVAADASELSALVTQTMISGDVHLSGGEPPEGTPPPALTVVAWRSLLR